MNCCNRRKKRDILLYSILYRLRCVFLQICKYEEALKQCQKHVCSWGRKDTPSEDTSSYGVSKKRTYKQHHENVISTSFNNMCAKTQFN
jgi:hypothetical protein